MIYVRFFIASLLCVSGVAHGLTFSGVVFGLDGKPAPGVRVWFSQNREVRTKETDDRGSFAFASVKAGWVDCVAWRKGAAMAGFSGRVADDGAVPLYLGEPAHIDLRIVSHTMAPVEGARLLDIEVSDAFHVPVDDFSEFTFPAIRSGEGGLMTISDLPKGCFVRFNVAHIDHAQTYIAYYATGRPRQDIVLRRGVELRGRVLGPGDVPVERARVTIDIRSQGEGGVRSLGEPLSDPEGFFHAKVSSGELVLHVWHPDYAPSDPIVGRVTERDEEVTVDVRLYAPNDVTGTVIGIDGNPAVGVDVAFGRKGERYTSTITDGKGRYLMKVAPGPGEVGVFPPEGQMVDGLWRVPVEVPEGSSVEVSSFTLVPLPVITGTIRGRDGSAEQGVYVRSTTLDRRLWALTDADGHFEIPLGTTRYQEAIGFAVEHGLRFYKSEFTVDPQSAKPLDIRLERYEPDETPVREGTIYAKLEAAPDTPADSEEFHVDIVGNDLSDIAGKAAPEWHCDESWINSAPLSVEALKGKVIVLTLWGGFAVIGPGRERIEELNWLYKTFKDTDDVAIVGIHDSSIELDGVKDYVKYYGIEYPVGRDIEPGVTFTDYHTTIIPQTVLIGKDGKVRYYDVDGRVLELIKVLRRE